MERDQLALHVSLRIGSEKTKESPFQLVKQQVGRNDDATMQAPSAVHRRCNRESPDYYA
jgi:hypothetical protein